MNFSLLQSNQEQCESVVKSSILRAQKKRKNMPSDFEIQFHLLQVKGQGNSKRKINWEILLNFCGPLRKCEL